MKKSQGKKVLIPSFKDMDPYDLPEEFSHLQAQDMSKLGFMQDLVHGIKKIIKYSDNHEKNFDRDNEQFSRLHILNGVNVEALLKRVYIYI